MIGIGDGWSEGSISCLVDDTDSQIISVANFAVEDLDAVRQYTDSFSCRATISLLLTEIRIQNVNSSDTNTTLTNATFVEFYNHGVTINLQVDSLVLNGIVQGTVTNNTLVNITSGTYVVFYDSNYDIPQCKNCDCDDTDDNGLCDRALYIACNNNNSQCIIYTTNNYA